MAFHCYRYQNKNMPRVTSNELVTLTTLTALFLPVLFSRCEFAAHGCK